MAPGNNERHAGHTGTIPKTKARNNCNVPQEAVTPTRRDMASNLVSTSLDWVPVSEYNTRTNYSNQSRKQTNNTNSDHELTDLDNSVTFESGFGRFVPVRPQPRALPLNVQNRDNIASEQHDDSAGSSVSSHTLHPYAHQMQNGLIPHSNHAAAAVMIVNPTTPNAVAGNMSQPFNAPNQNRNNLTRNLNPSRNSFEGTSNNNTSQANSNSRTATKTVNLINNMYSEAQGSFNNINDNTQGHRESARALGEAIVAACPDAAAVERRLGQIREYIRVTSSLVDTMRNSEDEAYIEHTKEEYDELVEMVMTLKESESKLVKMLADAQPDNIEVPSEEVESPPETNQDSTDEKVDNNNDANVIGNLKKVTNIENEQINKTLNASTEDDRLRDARVASPLAEHLESIIENDETDRIEIEELNTPTDAEDNDLNEVLRKNIRCCVEKVALIEELKNKNLLASDKNEQDVVVRPVSAQSNGSAYSENELWQNEIKNKMETSQMRLVALKQQQKRLQKYQEEAKQQLEEITRERQAQEMHAASSHENFANIQNQSLINCHQNRMYAANQIGVATTLPHSTETIHSHSNMAGNENEHAPSVHSTHSQDERFSHRGTNNTSNEEVLAAGRDSEPEDEELVSDRSIILQRQLRELQLKKQHMENLVTEFQKLQMATRLSSSHNTYSSSGEDSADDEPSRKCNKSGNIKNEDPFKLMEIKAIKQALQKTKDLMRTVDNYETDRLSVAGTHDDSYQMPTHSNIHDNKSEGGGSGSMGGWSNEGSVCRVRNTLPQKHKFTNEQHSQLQQHIQQQHIQQQHIQQQHMQQQQIQQQLQQQQLQQQQQHQQQNHEANLASLQELAQELRMETEKIMGERARIKDMVSNKETRKQKKVNEDRPGPSGIGPAERRQMQLRALLAEKQRELEALLIKEIPMSQGAASGSEVQNVKAESRTTSVVNQSYASEQEEPDSRSEQILLESQNSRDNDNFRVGIDSAMGGRSVNTLPSHLGSNYASDSDSASRTKSNQRNRMRRRLTQDRMSDGNNTPQQNNVNQNIRHEPRPDSTNVHMIPPMPQNDDNPANVPYLPLPQQCWTSNKSNQDMRTNQFTQNSHSQTMERLLATPQMSFPPSLPYNMMMPFGMMGGCGCGVWGAWCWQQLVTQQQEIQALRDQLHHLEERWRVETASHTLNNQVPPGNRANNYWDNFRSYSRQNLLSSTSKTNADGHVTSHPHPNPHPHPLVERSHNTLHHTSSSTSPSVTPKRNTNPPTQHPEEPRTNLAYERSLSFSSAPDVLNLNQHTEDNTPTHSRNNDDANVNLNRQDPFRNLNIANPIPEIVQSHSHNNLNNPTNSKRKSSSKLPAKNSGNRRNYTALDYSQTSNVNITSTSETPNPNLASTSRESHDKATSKLFDLLRENVYSEVTALIGVNESHPDFLIQLFRELQLISSDPLRQRVLQSIRSVLSQYSSIFESQTNEMVSQDIRSEAVTSENQQDSELTLNQNPNSLQIDSQIVRFLLLKSEEICTPELLEALASHIFSIRDGRPTQQAKKRLLGLLAKYENMRVCDISSDVIENLPMLVSSCNDPDESTHHTNEIPEPSIMQDVAGSLNLFSSSDTQLHQLNTCPYDVWPGHIHMEVDGTRDNSPRSSQEGKVDLINCSEMQNGDLAEADQSHETSDAPEGNDGGNAEALPDVVDTDEVTPTEAEAEWIGLDRVPTRLHMEESSEKQKD